MTSLQSLTTPDYFQDIYNELIALGKTAGQLNSLGLLVSSLDSMGCNQTTVYALCVTEEVCSVSALLIQSTRRNYFLGAGIAPSQIEILNRGLQKMAQQAMQANEQQRKQRLPALEKICTTRNLKQLSQQSAHS
jgi:hypothetical protein